MIERKVQVGSNKDLVNVHVGVKGSRLLDMHRERAGLGVRFAPGDPSPFALDPGAHELENLARCRDVSGIGVFTCRADRRRLDDLPVLSLEHCTRKDADAAHRAHNVPHRDVVLRVDGQDVTAVVEHLAAYQAVRAFEDGLRCAVQRGGVVGKLSLVVVAHSLRLAGSLLCLGLCEAARTRRERSRRLVEERARGACKRHRRVGQSRIDGGGVRVASLEKRIACEERVFWRRERDE